ncbi:mRNA cap guanine-N7 methyltransferase [Caligus rogercresseyi]|uniref:mRNA (guanine-N(7))-methyltransferase n=1 Tax=Caligus rogercresseyi TaxID=217165 RepID=A0A7T8GUF3_CALRO|nr:mRNA cap guanine-N7 methyltransferase [Caligus rogercresseyi]
MLLKEYIDRIIGNNAPGKRVSCLDLGCGKGGDLNKWSKSPVQKIVFADIAEVSVKQAETRFKDLAKRNGGTRTRDYEEKQRLPIISIISH